MVLGWNFIVIKATRAVQASGVIESVRENGQLAEGKHRRCGIFVVTEQYPHTELRQERHRLRENAKTRELMPLAKALDFLGWSFLEFGIWNLESWLDIGAQ